MKNILWDLPIPRSVLLNYKISIIKFYISEGTGWVSARIPDIPCFLEM